MQTLFGEAEVYGMTEVVARREPGTVLDPRTGEMLDLGSFPHAPLVGLFLELKRYEAKARECRIAIEDELVRRHGDRRAAQVIGAHEVDVERGWGRDWDIEDLMATVSHLCQESLLTVTDVEGLVTEETVRKVNGHRAQELLSRLQGEALMELSRCFEWRQRGRAKVKITPVVELEP